MADVMFLIQGEGGRLATVVARSARAAATQYMRSRGVRVGVHIKVKRRGSGDPWEEFIVKD
jgi:hypothetical protein